MTRAIQSPLLQQAYDCDWYFPPDLPKEITNHPDYERAYNEGWHEWIETPLDFEAVKHGFCYDQSLDVDRKPVYWIDGGWQYANGDKIDMDDEQDAIGLVGRGDYTARWCETFLTFTGGDLSGKPFRFLPWMRKVVNTLFGWVDQKAKAKYRRYNFMYLAVAKKNGKSYMLSALCNYMLFGDRIPGTQVYLCASVRDQARIIFNEAARMAKMSEYLKDMAKVLDATSRITYEETGSFLKVLSADAHNNDGIKSAFTAVDEIHRHPNRKLFDVMERAGRSLPEPLLAVITTFGPSKTDGSVWAEIQNDAESQMLGDKPHSWRRLNFIASAEPIVVTATEPIPKGATRIPVRRLWQPIDVSNIEFELSEVDDTNVVKVRLAKPAKRYQTYIEVEPVPDAIPQFSEAMANKEWATLHGVQRSNPSAGVLFKPQEILDEVANIRGPDMEAQTKQLSFNITSGAVRRWISAAMWQASADMVVQPDKLVGKPAFAALDFSFGGDLVALALDVPQWDVSIPFLNIADPHVDLMTWAWVPEDGLDERCKREQFPYRHYAEQDYFLGKGHIRICEGRVAHFGQIVRDCLEIFERFQIIAVAYDPNYAQFAIPLLEANGITCIEHRQGAVSMSPACKRFRDMLFARQLAHGNNPVLNRAVEGAVPHKPDKAGNVYLSKGDSKVRIDPLVAHVMAINFSTNPPIQQSGAYSGPGTGIWS